jgi:hypothetical protein
MVDAEDFFTFSNPLFSDAFVAIVLYIVYRLLAKKLPRISEGIKEASLMFLVFMCYDASRYFALEEEDEAVANAKKVIGFEKETHIFIEIPLQKMIMKHESFAKFLNSFYLGAHWGGLVIFFVWAYARVLFASPSKMDRRRKEYVTARGRFIIMNMLAAISFMAFPCAPPRALPEYGFIDTLYSISHADVYTSTRRFVNPYAAMPSMHQGYSLLFALTIVIMLRSEILAARTESDDDDDSEAGLVSKTADTTTDSRLATMRAYLSEAMRRYNRYHLLSRETRQNERKLFLISLLPIALLAYPAFMFVVIVGTGNHFVLDALAGAAAFCLACLIFPIVALAIDYVDVHFIRRASSALTQVSARIVGVKAKDIEMGDVKESEMSEEKKGFLSSSYPLAETA